MLELGFQAGLRSLGISSRVALCCEWDSYAAAILLERMEAAFMEPCPIWCGDLAELDLHHMAGQLDCFVAGLPCQPYSLAGKRQGNSDQRSHGEDNSGPVPQFLRHVEDCRPALVFLENVPAWVTGGHFRSVGEELCRFGYTIEEPLFITAESVGASHRRERVFVLAHSAKSRNWRLSEPKKWLDAADIERSGDELADAERQPGSAEREPRSGRRSRASTLDGPMSGESGPNVGDSQDSNRWQELQPREPTEHRRAGPARTSQCVAVAAGQRPQEWSGIRSDRVEELAAVARSRSLFAPGPNADWQQIPEWLWPATQPGFRVLADGLAGVVDENRTDQLRCVGNGVVPLAAAVAASVLLSRAINRK